MKRSTDRILTTHIGSLPRPADLLELAEAQPYDEAAHLARLKTAVAEVVAKEVATGLDVIDDGEYSKSSFVGYINQRLGGFEPRTSGGPTASPVMRDHQIFPEYYARVRERMMAERKAAGGDKPNTLEIMYPALKCTGPISYTGQAILQRDIDNLKAALQGKAYEEIFMPAISPANAEFNKTNEYYRTEEEFSIALAEALAVEYKAIVDAGFLVQVDDPMMITYYNRFPDKSVADCRKWAEGRVEILNHALKGIPEEKIRFHTCYSFDMAPRVGDMELKHLLDIILRINAGAFTFEGGNPRHEHEWQLWKTTKFPDGKVLIPGVVAISTLVVEHPELIAERLGRYANLVGRENVVAGVDCGFGTFAREGDIHPSIAWAKLEALVEGAKIASDALWSKKAA